MHPSNRMGQVASYAIFTSDIKREVGKTIMGLDKYEREELKRLKSSDVQQIPKWMEKCKKKR